MDTFSYKICFCIVIIFGNNNDLPDTNTQMHMHRIALCWHNMVVIIPYLHFSCYCSWIDNNSRCGTEDFVHRCNCTWYHLTWHEIHFLKQLETGASEKKVNQYNFSSLCWHRRCDLLLSDAINHEWVIHCYHSCLTIYQCSLQFSFYPLAVYYVCWSYLWS